MLKVSINRGTDYGGLLDFYKSKVVGSFTNTHELKTKVFEEIILNWHTDQRIKQGITPSLFKECGIDPNKNGKSHHINVTQDIKILVKKIVESHELIKSQSQLASFALMKGIELDLLEKHIKRSI